MSPWRQITRGLRALFRRDTADRDVADEVRHYLDEATAAGLARGLAPDAALRAARLELGNVTAVQEQVRSYGWENLVDVLAADIRHAARRLRGSPGFTSVAVLTIAVGLGATTAIFGAVNPILFEPLPYPGADRIVAIQEFGRGGSRNDGTFGMFRGLSERARSFEAMAVFKPWQPAITGSDQPEHVVAERVSHRFFRVFGVAPALGRDFQASDDQPNGPNVAIVSYRLWQRRLHGDRAIVGRTITLADTPFEVIGVMPKGFENVVSPSADLWAPLQYDMTQGVAWGHHLKTVARLRPGIAIDQATREIAGVGAAELREQRPETYGRDVRFAALPLKDEVTRGVRPALLVVLGAVTLVLLIACVNVTNLLLARGVHQRPEFALRAALGAAQRRLIRPVLVESLLLATIGGGLGLGFAVLGIRALVALAPPGLPRADAIGIDASVFAFGLILTTMVGLAGGLVPALQAARSDPQLALQAGTRRATGGHQRMRRALVMVEVALAFVLLVGSGLLLRSLQQLFSIPSGFDPAGTLTMRVEASGHRFDSDSNTFRHFAQVLDAVRRVPGVTAAGLTSQLPLSGDDEQYGARLEPDPSGAAGNSPVYRYAVTPGYLEAMRIPLRSGRTIGREDVAGARPVALISESAARRWLPGGDPVGRQLRMGGGPVLTVVGVVGDVKQMSLASGVPDAVYLPSDQSPFADHEMSLVVRAGRDVAGLAPAIRRAVWSVDKDQPIVRVATMAALVTATAAERRFLLVLFEAFALAALALAAAGIYGVLSGSVAERTREIGVRSALGASRGSILALVLRQGMFLTILGTAIGLAGAVVASRALVSLLFSISHLDPVTYLGVAAMLTGVAGVACAVPAWRAARVDPAITLRAE